MSLSKVARVDDLSQGVANVVDIFVSGLFFWGRLNKPAVSAHFCCPKSPLAHLDDQIICRIKVIHKKCSSRSACTAERFTCRPTQHNKVSLETLFVVLIVDKMNYAIVDLLN